MLHSQTRSRTPERLPLQAFLCLVQAETTTRCNLRCAMCVKSADGCRIPETHMPMESFTRLA